jgi:hypothetical protein
MNVEEFVGLVNQWFLWASADDKRRFFIELCNIPGFADELSAWNAAEFTKKHKCPGSVRQSENGFVKMPMFAILVSLH